MISVTFMTDDETHIATAFMHHTPSVGELIWLLPVPDGESRAWKVMAVAHWVSETLHYHRVAVYLDRINPQ